MDENDATLQLGLQQVDNDVTVLTNTKYRDTIHGKFGFEAFLTHWNQLKGTNYSINWDNREQDILPNEKECINLLIRYFTIKAINGNDNEYGFRSGYNNALNGRLAHTSIGIQYSALSKHFERALLFNPQRYNPIINPAFKKRYDGMYKTKKKKARIERTANKKRPLFYAEIKKLINASYSTSFIKGYTEELRTWYRAWISLSYVLFLRGDDLVRLTFDNLKIGVDDDNAACIRLTFIDRKAYTAYDKGVPTLCIPPNPEEEAIDAFKFLKDYYDLLNNNMRHISGYTTDSMELQNSYVFPNRTPTQFMTSLSKQGSTNYYRDSLEKGLFCVSINPKHYALHSLRTGGCRHKLIFSPFPFNVEQVRHVAGWTDREDTISNTTLI